MKKLAEKYEIIVCWCYGVPGHGRGLVDAMSSFGCKQPLKHAILTTDKWFSSAEQMVCYLRKHFETLGDSSKEHYLVDEADTANKNNKTGRTCTQAL